MWKMNALLVVILLPIFCCSQAAENLSITAAEAAGFDKDEQ